MNKKPNHRCRICGTEYYACNDCASRLKAQYGGESWRAVADIPSHYQIYVILVHFVRKEISATDALQQLNHIGIGDMDTFLPNYRSLIQQVIAEAETAEQERTNSKIGAEPEKADDTSAVSKPKPRARKKAAKATESIDE